MTSKHQRATARTARKKPAINYLPTTKTFDPIHDDTMRLGRLPVDLTDHHSRHAPDRSLAALFMPTLHRRGFNVYSIAICSVAFDGGGYP